MNFTREPIIETVITPREGHKLILRNSKGGAAEELIVEAIEVVSFGRSFFFRSIEGPKAFLLPVTDYEILESKEARVALKSVQTDRQIKIGGGREASPRPQQQHRPPPPELAVAPEGPRVPREDLQPPNIDHSHPAQQHERGKRGLRRRGRRGRGGPDRGAPNGGPPSDRPLTAHEREQQEFHEQLQQSGDPALAHHEEPMRASVPDEPKAPSFISKLFPPPPTLIKETLSRYKISEEGEIFPDAGEERPEATKEFREEFDLPIPSDPEDDSEV